MLRSRLGLLGSACFVSLAIVASGCGSDGRSDGSGSGTGGSNSGSGSTGSGSTGSGSTGSGGITGTGGIDLGQGGDVTTCTTDCPPPPNCGDGALTPDEACDDHNKQDGDGCSADCLTVEPGFTCATPGKECKPYARCGDGMFSAPEQCDDGNNDAGDGCSKTCKFEIGFKCTTDSPSVCTTTTCGDGKIEGAEACDVKGNKVPFDGCSAQCQNEPDCSGTSCVSSCGDGIVIGEDCDDGNNNDGDGCSEDCKVEEGFVCTTAPCEEVDGKCVLRVPVLYRDFNAKDAAGGHPDFERGGCDGVTEGLVEDLLENGIPKYKGPAGAGCIGDATTFDSWYKPSSKSKTLIDTLVLFDNGNGGYVNRYGANGEKWGTYDGNPLFFPIDNKPGALTPTSGYYAAEINSAYGGGTAPAPNSHNFHFTSEVHYWFQYTAPSSPSKTAKLDFTGDDDVWVFINKHLAVDLGGLHQPQSGGVQLDGAHATEYGLEDGKVYDIAVFHAERKITGSSFRLTLSGFNAGRSECTPNCGDGIVGLGEECDDGVNEGGYGKCQPGCVLGGFCGDGVKQEGESCDDGNRNNDDECNNACRFLIVK